MSDQSEVAHIRTDWSAYLRADAGALGDHFLPVVLVIGAVLSFVALAAITWDAGTGRVWRSAVHGDWVFLAVVPLGLLASHVGYTLAYRQVLRTGPHGDCLGVWDTIAIVAAGFGPLSPRGGFRLDSEELQKRGLDAAEAERRVRILGVLEYCVLAPATLGAAAYMAAEGAHAQAGLLPSWMIGVPAGAAVVLLLLMRYRSRRDVSRWPGPLRRFLDAIEDLLRLLGDWPAGPVALAGMLLYWAGEVAVLTACVDVFAHRRGAIAVMIVGYATGYALTRRSLPLGSAGVVEALLPFAMNWVGFPLAASIVSVIVYRLCSLWLALLPAYAGWRRIRSPASRPPPPRAPAPT